MASLLCEHWELFSEAWQTSGMMRNGQVFALPMPAHLTADSEFSSQLQGSMLRSPKASEGQGGALGEAEAIKRGNTVGVRDQVMDLVASQGMKVSRTELNEDSLLPTPNTMEHREIKTPEQIAALKEKSPGGYRNLREEVINNLPTPTTMDAKATNNREVTEKFLKQGKQTCLTYEITMMPTPMARDWKGDTAPHERNGVLQTDSVERAIFHSGEVTAVSWGKFEPAIRRWEVVMNRPAPAPTLPDGKEGAHRLSPWFTEWMMGLPEGWICDPEIGLTRNEQLKACGNGVVPQQAELALRILLEGIDFSPAGGGK